MQDIESAIEKVNADYEYLKSIHITLFENLNILLENQKNKVDNQDLVVQNQSLIIRNQDVIVNNQLNIIRNQHQIVENQATLAVILKTQAKLLHLVEKLSGNDISESDIYLKIEQMLHQSKGQFQQNFIK